MNLRYNVKQGIPPGLPRLRQEATYVLCAHDQESSTCTCRCAVVPIACGTQGLNTQRFNYTASYCSSRELLLSGDQISIAYSVGLKAAFHHEIRTFDFASFVLNPKWLNPLADEFVRELFFRIGKTGPAFPFDQKLTVVPGFQQDARRMTKYCRNFSDLVKGAGKGVHAGIRVIRIHRGLTSYEESRVVFSRLQLRDGLGALHQLHMIRRANESEAD